MESSISEFIILNFRGGWGKKAKEIGELRPAGKEEEVTAIKGTVQGSQSLVM